MAVAALHTTSTTRRTRSACPTLLPAGAATCGAMSTGPGSLAGETPVLSPLDLCVCCLKLLELRAVFKSPCMGTRCFGEQVLDQPRRPPAFCKGKSRDQCSAHFACHDGSSVEQPMPIACCSRASSMPTAIDLSQPQTPLSLVDKILTHSALFGCQVAMAHLQFSLATIPTCLMSCVSSSKHPSPARREPKRPVWKPNTGPRRLLLHLQQEHLLTKAPIHGVIKARCCVGLPNMGRLGLCKEALVVAVSGVPAADPGGGPPFVS